MVKLKRKVTLRTKVADTPEPDKSNIYKWLLLGGVVIAAIVVFLFLKPDSSENSVSDGIQNEIHVSTAELTNEKVENVIENNTENQSNILLTEKSNDITKTAITVVETTDNASNISTNYIEQKAISVIRGNYGNGEERKTKLGREYQIIQDKVNEMYRNGLVR